MKYRDFILEGQLSETKRPQKGDVVSSACGRQGPIRRLTEILVYVDLSDGTQQVSALAPVSISDLQPDGPSAWKETWAD